MDIREALLDAIKAQEPKGPMGPSLHEHGVLDAVARKLGAIGNQELEQAILTQWHELFRTGFLAWGLNIANHKPPLFHVTHRGRESLAKLTRDPANPAGYLRHLASIGTLNPIAQSYLEEALQCYVAGLYKSAAVMIGGATESVILELRELTVKKLESLGQTVPKGVNDWMVKAISDALRTFFDGRKAQFGRELREPFEAYWSAFAQQIRAVRNEAGHPTSVEAVTADTVHASFLIFPEIVRIAISLACWVDKDLK